MKKSELLEQLNDQLRKGELKDPSIISKVELADERFVDLALEKLEKAKPQPKVKASIRPNPGTKHEMHAHVQENGKDHHYVIDRSGDIWSAKKHSSGTYDAVGDMKHEHHRGYIMEAEVGRMKANRNAHTVHINPKTFKSPLGDDDVEKTLEKSRKKVFTEDDAFDAHIKEMERVYGKKRTDNANIGWGVDEGSIASKVYGDEKNPTMVHQTDWDESGIIGHNHEEYAPIFNPKRKLNAPPKKPKLKN